jgi:hypothetical protein
MRAISIKKIQDKIFRERFHRPLGIENWLQK